MPKESILESDAEKLRRRNRELSILNTILSKLGEGNRTEAVAIAAQQGLVDLRGE